MNNDAYKLKYLKYKEKYLELKNISGGGNCNEIDKIKLEYSSYREDVDDVTLKSLEKDTCKKFKKGDWVFYSQWKNKTRSNPVGTLRKYIAYIEKIDLTSDQFGNKSPTFTLFIYKDIKTGTRLNEYFFEFENHHVNSHAFIEVIDTDDISHDDMVLSAIEYNTRGKLRKMEGIAEPEKEIEVQVGTRIALLPLYKIGEPIEMNDRQLLAYKLRPEDGRLIDTDENTIMISELPGFKSYLFKVKIIPSRYYGKSSTKQLIRLK